MYKETNMKKIYKILAMLCICLIVLSAYISCKRNTTDTEKDSESETLDNSISLNIGTDGKTEYSVIYGSDCSKEVKDSAILLKENLQKALGENAKVNIAEDISKEGKYEILVGNTNRKESKEVLSKMKYLDQSVVICNEKIVINAYKDKLIVKGVDHFISQIKSSENGNVVFSTKNELSIKEEYKYDDIKIGNTSVKGYTIVYYGADNKISKAAAYNLRESIGKASGLCLQIKKDTDKESDKEILIGRTNRTNISEGVLNELDFEIAKNENKLLIATKKNSFALTHTIEQQFTFEESGEIALKKGSIEVSKDPILTAMCFSDVHNNFAMLEPPYTIRGCVDMMIKEILATEGKVDLALVGGDYMSDYPNWTAHVNEQTGQTESGWLPYEYYLGFKKKSVETFEKLTKDGKVMYVAGNHDYAQGEMYEPNYNKAIGAPITKGPGKNGSYNSFEFYFTGPMNEKIGELEGNDKYVITGTHTNEQYLLGFHYVVNGVHFIGFSPDPDLIWKNQGYGFNPGSIRWLKDKIEEIDPNGTELIFVICHYSPAQRNANAIKYPDKFDLNNPWIDDSIASQINKLFRGHRNIMYLFGHWHRYDSEHTSYFKNYTVPNVIHYTNQGQIMKINGTESSSLEVLKSYDSLGYSAIWMGGFRYDYHDVLFKRKTGVTGYGGYTSERYWKYTETPKFAQGLFFKVFEDRVEFTMKTVGHYAGYHQEDKIAPYTIYLYK